MAEPATPEQPAEGPPPGETPPAEITPVQSSSEDQHTAPSVVDENGGPASDEELARLARVGVGGKAPLEKELRPPRRSKAAAQANEPATDERPEDHTGGSSPGKNVEPIKPRGGGQRGEFAEDKGPRPRARRSRRGTPQAELERMERGRATQEAAGIREEDDAADYRGRYTRPPQRPVQRPEPAHRPEPAPRPEPRTEEPQQRASDWDPRAIRAEIAKRVGIQPEKFEAMDPNLRVRILRQLRASEKEGPKPEETEPKWTSTPEQQEEAHGRIAARLGMSLEQYESLNQHQQRDAVERWAAEHPGVPANSEPTPTAAEEAEERGVVLPLPPPAEKPAEPELEARAQQPTTPGPAPEVETGKVKKEEPPPGQTREDVLLNLEAGFDRLQDGKGSKLIVKDFQITGVSSEEAKELKDRIKVEGLRAVLETAGANVLVGMENPAEPGTVKFFDISQVKKFIEDSFDWSKESAPTAEPAEKPTPPGPPAPEAPPETAQPEQPKPTPETGRWQKRLGKGLEVTGIALDVAERVPIAGSLVKLGHRYVEKYGPADKNKVIWLSGVVSGGLINVGLTAFVPFLAFGPSRFLRSLAWTGVAHAASFGANTFQGRAFSEILKRYNVNAEDGELYTSMLNDIKKALRAGDQKTANELQEALSKAMFEKYGTAATRGKPAEEAAEVSAEMFLAELKKLEKYDKLSKGVRDFVAGVAAGTMATSIGFGIAERVDKKLLGSIKHLLDRMLGPNVGHVPHPTEVLTHTPTPTGTPVPEGLPTGVSPDALNIFEHLPPDQRERLLDIASHPDKLDAFNHWIAAHEGVPTHIPDIDTQFADLLHNPDLSRVLEIHQGDTVGQLLANNNFDLTWGPDNAELFGTHVWANYDMLQSMHDSVQAAGLTVEDFPTKAELAGLIRAAAGGDALAMHRLTEALHWIPAGGRINILSSAGFEQARRVIGLG